MIERLIFFVFFICNNNNFPSQFQGQHHYGRRFQQQLELISILIRTKIQRKLSEILHANSIQI